MIDPYRMVVVNLIAPVLLVLGIFIYKHFFKKKMNLFLILLCISILPVISIFRTGVYESGDFNIHLYRAMAFYDSLSEGNFIPSWAENLNATYGYPLFIFNYTLPYYVISTFHKLGFSFISSQKILLATSFIFSGLGMFFLVKELTKKPLVSFTSAIFYLFAPYHLVDIHFKVVLGEILFFAVLPFAFLSLYKLYIKKTVLLFLVSSLALTLLIMSHIIIAIFAYLLICCYFLFLSKKEGSFKKIITIIPPLIASVVVTCYIWTPPFFLKEYTIVEKMILTTVYFPTFSDLLYSPWKFGFLFQGPRGEISHALGYTHILIVLFAFWSIVRKPYKKNLSEVVFWIGAFFVFLFLISPLSKPLWETLPMLKVTGSHRLIILAVFCSSILAGHIVTKIRKQWVVTVLLGVTVFSTILNWGQRKVIPEVSDKTLQENLWKSTSEGEGHFYANPLWSDLNRPWRDTLPKNHLETTKGTADIRNVKRTSTSHTYVVYSKTPTVFRENTLYFPGWKAFSNDSEIPITYEDKNDIGLITFRLPAGLYFVEIKYEDQPTYLIFKILSAGGITGILSASIYLFLKQRFYAKIHYSSLKR